MAVDLYASPSSEGELGEQGAPGGSAVRRNDRVSHG